MKVEQFVDNAVSKTEIATLQWVLKMLKNWPPEMVEQQIKQYVKELQDGRN